MTIVAFVIAFLTILVMISVEIYKLIRIFKGRNTIFDYSDLCVVDCIHSHDRILVTSIDEDGNCLNKNITFEDFMRCIKRELKNGQN